VIARLAQPGLQQRLGTTVIIENRPGGSGTIGAGIVAKSPPDGNTWLLDFDTHASNQFTVAKISYDTEKDFDPVLLVGTAPTMRWPEWVVLIAGLTGSALRAVRPFQPYTSRRMPDAISFTPRVRRVPCSARPWSSLPKPFGPSCCQARWQQPWWAAAPTTL